MRFFALVLTLWAVSAGTARADVWADLASDERAVTALDAARAQVEGHRVTLAARSQEAAAEIDRVKNQPAGIRRDAKLQELLAAQKATSDELERIAGELRGRSSLLAGARRKLIADCDRALNGQMIESRRVELARMRTAQAAWLALPERAGDHPLGVARASADPLDGPRELQDKADLLRDSEDKLRREVKLLALRIDNVERRRHLRERAGAVDEDLFGESISNRRSPRVSSTNSTDHGTGTTTPTAGPAGGATGSGGAGGAGGGGGSGGGGGGSGGVGGPSNGVSGNPGQPTPPTPATFGAGATSDTATVLRDLVDPATLDELRRSDGGDDLERQVRALRRAQNELQGLANELDRRAKSLSTRADELKHKK